MKAKPLTKKEAKNLSEAYQHLKGSIIFNGKDDYKVIDCVCVSPSYKKDKLAFIKKYSLFRNAEKAMSQYEGIYFDVLVIFKSSTSLESNLQFVELKNFLYQANQLTG